MRWNLSSTYLDLPPALYSLVQPVPSSRPELVWFNQTLSDELGLGEPDDDAARILAGNAVVEGSTPFSQAYAGHQFGHFTVLGDGRAVVLGEHAAPDGRVVDLQLKGSGRTPYSRSGDGRAALGPMLREALVGEALHALGVPTTRILAVSTTGEGLWRDGPRPGAVAVRVAASHLRVGTFEYASATGDPAVLAALLDYTLARHLPGARDSANPALALLEHVVETQARLVAQWMSVGFVHGVMNTDNVALSGQSLDFGPCAFLDTFRLGQVFSSIDQNGRYSYGRQPGMARWNVTRFAETLIPLLAGDAEAAIERAQPVLDEFADRYRGHYRRLMAAKLGLARTEDGDLALVEDLLTAMEAANQDYAATWRSLTDDWRGNTPPTLAFAPEWSQRWHARLGSEADSAAAQDLQSRSNPVYLPRNQVVQDALDAAENGDLAPFRRVLGLVSTPYTRQAGGEDLERPPEHPADARPFVTTCGT